MNTENKKRRHLEPLSKIKPREANGATCDEHDTEKERKKCHKGKINPPI